jgi:tungstate transport system substrate-binding protein
VGQGMGETLLFANEKLAYTLTDRATWLAMKSRLPGLTVIVGGEEIAQNADPLLLNPYGVIVVNPARHPKLNTTGAEAFAAWITSADTQRAIGTYGVDRFGQALFKPGKAP